MQRENRIHDIVASYSIALFSSLRLPCDPLDVKCRLDIHVIERAQWNRRKERDKKEEESEEIATKPQTQTNQKLPQQLPQPSP